MHALHPGSPQVLNHQNLKRRVIRSMMELLDAEPVEVPVNFDCLQFSDLECLSFEMAIEVVGELLQNQIYLLLLTEHFDVLLVLGQF
jgi:hypothetical protein